MKTKEYKHGLCVTGTLSKSGQKQFHNSVLVTITFVCHAQTSSDILTRASSNLPTEFNNLTSTRCLHHQGKRAAYSKEGPERMWPTLTTSVQAPWGTYMHEERTPRSWPPKIPTLLWNVAEMQSSLWNLWVGLRSSQIPSERPLG